MSDAPNNRETLIALSTCLRRAFEAPLGSVDRPERGRFEDADVAALSGPIRTALVRFGAPINDCVVLVGSLPEASISALAAAAGSAVAGSCTTPITVDAPELHHFRSPEAANEQLAALWNEAVLRFATPGGTLLVVAGETFLEAAQTAGLYVEPDTETREVTISLGEEFAAVEFGEFAPAVDEGQWASLLSGVEVDVSAELGRTSMQLGEMSTLDRDAVVTLDQEVDDLVNVYVNGAMFATARLVVVDGQYGIEIVEVLDTAAAL